MRAIVAQEIGEPPFDFRVADALAQRPAHQHRRAIADEAENHLVDMRFASQVRQRGIHRVRQIELGINQRAVQVEDQHAHARETLVIRGHPQQNPREILATSHRTNSTIHFMRQLQQCHPPRPGTSKTLLVVLSAFAVDLIVAAFRALLQWCQRHDTYDWVR